MVNYAKNLVKGTRFVLISTLIVAIFGYLLRILLARSFSVEEYGMIYAIIAFFGIFRLTRRKYADNPESTFTPLPKDITPLGIELDPETGVDLSADIKTSKK